MKLRIKKIKGDFSPGIQQIFFYSFIYLNGNVQGTKKKRRRHSGPPEKSPKAKNTWASVAQQKS